MADLKNRISPKLREAIRLMVEDGLTRAEAAETAGLTDHALYCALRKPHVRSLRREMLGDLRESAASRTIARGEKLADEAQSEHVRNDANKWLASLDDATSPVQRSETTHRYPDGAPGLTIIFGSEAALVGRTIDAQAIERPAHLRHLPPPVPHPAMVREAQMLEAKRREESGDE